jgi:hypothetical protein
VSICAFSSSASCVCAREIANVSTTLDASGLQPSVSVYVTPVLRDFNFFFFFTEAVPMTLDASIPLSLPTRLLYSCIGSLCLCPRDLHTV